MVDRPTAVEKERVRKNKGLVSPGTLKQALVFLSILNSALKFVKAVAEFFG